MKESMYNQYEAIKSNVHDDFKNIENILTDEIKSLSNKYLLIEIEQYLLGYIVCECAELRLRNAMGMKQALREEKTAGLFMKGKLYEI